MCNKFVKFMINPHVNERNANINFSNFRHFTERNNSAK